MSQKAPARKHSYQYQLSHQGRQEYDTRRQELQTKRQDVIDYMRRTNREQPPKPLDMANQLKVIQQIDREIEKLEFLLLHSAA